MFKAESSKIWKKTQFIIFLTLFFLINLIFRIANAIKKTKTNQITKKKKKPKTPQTPFFLLWVSVYLGGSGPDFGLNLFFLV